MIAYHDEEWGVPVYDDKRLFEFLVLEGAQAGLSWSTILKKRANYRAAFDNFDPSKDRELQRKTNRSTAQGSWNCT
jgi:DNA-3-methyladenine glycosylase I